MSDICFHFPQICYLSSLGNSAMVICLRATDESASLQFYSVVQSIPGLLLNITLTVTWLIEFKLLQHVSCYDWRHFHESGIDVIQRCKLHDVKLPLTWSPVSFEVSTSVNDPEFFVTRLSLFGEARARWFLNDFTKSAGPQYISFVHKYIYSTISAILIVFPMNFGHTCHQWLHHGCCKVKEV